MHPDASAPVKQCLMAQIVLNQQIAFASIKESTMIQAPHGMILVMSASVGIIVSSADLFVVLPSSFVVLTIPWL